ncbi:MAG: hypothetical protein [Caudoviricetes sp.]|nr:MAG: hypothetical protein [Caudoviricetes sp.]
MAGQHGNRVGRRNSAPNMTGGSQYASMYMYGSLLAVANAECNPGTRRVEDMRGNQIWPEKPRVLN